MERRRISQSLLKHGDGAGKLSTRAGAGDIDEQQVIEIDSAGKDRITGTLGHRFGFPGEHGFIDEGFAAIYNSIGSEALSNSDGNGLAGNQFRNADKMLAAVAKLANLLGQRVVQMGNRT